MNRILEALGRGLVCTITCLEVILIQERFCSRLVQEPSSQVIPVSLKVSANVVDGWRLRLLPKFLDS